MTTLAQAVTTTSQKTWGLSAPLAASTTHLQVDSEIVAVTNLTTRQSMFVAENPLQCRVKRGEAGTTAATHAQGASVSELIDPNFGGASGGVSVEVPPAAPVTVTNLIAPGAQISGDTADLSSVLVARQLRADVAFDSPGMDDIAPLFTVPAGALVLRVLAFVTSAWNITGGTISDYPANSVNLGAVTSMDNPAALLPGIESDDSFNFPEGSWLFATEQGLGFDPTGLPTVGTMTVIAIIATPAS